MPPKMATFLWEKFGLHLGRLLAKSEMCISEKRGRFLESAPFFLKLLEKRKSFFQKFLKKLAGHQPFSLGEPFWPEAPPPSPLLIFFFPHRVWRVQGFRFAEIQLNPPFSAIFGMYFPFLSPLSFPIFSYWPAFPLWPKEDAPPTQPTFFEKSQKIDLRFS